MELLRLVRCLLYKEQGIISKAIEEIRAWCESYVCGSTNEEYLVSIIVETGLLFRLFSSLMEFQITHTIALISMENTHNSYTLRNFFSIYKYSEKVHIRREYEHRFYISKSQNYIEFNDQNWLFQSSVVFMECENHSQDSRKWVRENSSFIHQLEWIEKNDSLYVTKFHYDIFLK